MKPMPISPNPSNIQPKITTFLPQCSLYNIIASANDLAAAVALQTGHATKVDSLRLTILNTATRDTWKEQQASVLFPFHEMALLYADTYEIFAGRGGPNGKF
jgi:hypothetical protein